MGIVPWITFILLALTERATHPQSYIYLLMAPALPALLPMLFVLSHPSST